MSLVGIRAEDKSPWERRVPLVPEDVRRLRRDHGLSFVVEPSPIRIYDDGEYRAAGAEVGAHLGPAGVVFAVKEIPMGQLVPEKTYAFFAHVIKGQSHNMPLLRRLLELRCTLIDYERITDDVGKRLVLFGREAGQAGMIDSLHVLGRRLRRKGYETPLAELRPAHEYEDLAAAKIHLAEVGRRLDHGVEVGDPPLVFAFTGKGNVSRGAQEIFDVLPHEEVTAEQLPEVARRGDLRDRLVKVRFRKKHLATPKEVGKKFDAAEFRKHPERYRARLPEFIPYVSVLINGIFWTDAYPRYLSREAVRELWRDGHRKLELIGDVTCDIDGAVELTHKATQPDHPTYVYDPETDRWTDGDEGEGIVVLAVDNLPCELPRDASDHFSRSLRDHVPAIANADYRRPYEELELPPEIHRAVITHRGELTPDYRYLESYLEES
jgi:alpha-aminoadipic semialdehyde synthase